MVAGPTGAIRKITKDAVAFAANLIELKKRIPKQKEAFTERWRLLQARAEVKTKIFNALQAFSVSMNRNLVAAVVDYKVAIRFHEALLSPELKELTKTTMGWRTSQVPKAALIASNMSPSALLPTVDAVGNKHHPVLRNRSVSPF